MSPEGEPHRFSLKEGLFRYLPNNTHNPVEPAAFNNAAGHDSNDSVTDRPEVPQVGKQGEKQGKKGSRGLLSSKTLSLLLTLMLTTWACGTNTTDPQLQLVINELRAIVRTGHLLPTRLHLDYTQGRLAASAAVSLYQYEYWLLLRGCGSL